MENLGALLPLVLIVFAFYFMIMRPARNRQKAYLETQRELQPGQRVMIASGIFGDIVSLGDETLELSIAPQTVVTVNRQAVARVIPPAEPGTEPGTED